MKKNLIASNQNSKVDDSWIERLWAWADENDVSDYKLWYGGWKGVPRNKEKLLNLTELNLEYSELIELPKEIGNLTNLTYFHLTQCELKELPKEIGNLKNLTHLAISHNPNLILTTEQKEWIIELEKNGCYVGMDDDLLDRNLSNKQNIEGLIEKENNLLIDNSWVDKLWEWANEYNNEHEYAMSFSFDESMINHIDLPSSKEEFFKLSSLDLWGSRLSALPKEIGNILNLTTLYLGINELKNLPKEIGNLLKLTELDLGDNELKKLPKEIGNLTNLEKLDLGSNQLTSLPKEISNLVNLTSLNLGIDERMVSMFEYGEELSYTYYNQLHGNEFTALPNEIINLSNLIVLNLSGNNLTTLPKEIVNLTNLTILSLSSNKLNTLPNEIVNLDNLTNLDLKNNPNLILTTEQKEWIIELKNNGCHVSMDDDLLNKIDTSLAISEISIDDSWIDKLWEWADENDVPDYKFNQYSTGEGLPRDKEKLLNLSELNLDTNKLSLLPKEIGNLTNLVELNLAWNQLINLPKEIGNLTNLKILDMAFDNLIKELPKEIGNLTNLTELSLAWNQLTIFPKEIINLINLNSLNLWGNNLKELPKEIGNLTNLTHINLNENNFTNLPKEITSLTNLTHLNLSHNSNLILTTEQKEWILNLRRNGCNVSYDYDLLDRALSNKKDLIDDNWIDKLLEWADNKKIPKNQFRRNKEEVLNLTELHLGDNGLKNLPKEIGNLINLNSLYVNYNRLIELPKEIENLRKLTRLFLYDNNLTTLPKEIENLINLNSLDLANNKFTSLPKEIGTITNLTVLVLKGNKLLTLSKKIGNLTQLTALYLNINDLINLPKEIVNLTNLTTLDLKYNSNLILTTEQKEWILNLEKNGCKVYYDNDLLDRSLSNKKGLIEKENSALVDDSWIERLWEWADENDVSKDDIPRDKQKLLNLTGLYLGDNQLTELPKEIGNLDNLTELQLSNNQLTELLKEIGNLTNLTWLGLYHNPNLILTQEQKEWIKSLKAKGCEVYIDDDLLDRNLPIIKKNIIDDTLKYKRNTNINLEDISAICQSKFEDIDLFRENLYEILRHMGYVEDYSTTPTEEGKKRFLVSKKHAYGYMSLIRKEFAGELLVEVEKFVNDNQELNEKLNYPFQPWKRIDLDGLIV